VAVYTGYVSDIFLEILQMLQKQTLHYIPSFEALLTFPYFMVKNPVVAV
jgi:hypothetical protein